MAVDEEIQEEAVEPPSEGATAPPCESTEEET